jgi:putative nucleotidyltransferase with HDIG domain
MTSEDLQYFREWFTGFCKSFYSTNPEDQKNIILKEVHTSLVCKNILALAEDLSLNAHKKLLAETVALFHDIGRFPQYARFRTFKDSISVNHGLLGAETLSRENLLHMLPHDEQRIIIESVKFHNAFSVPKKENEEVIFFTRLVRDADKLDIWRVFIEYYESSSEGKASAVGLGLPDTPEYSTEVLSCLYRKEIVSLSKIKTLNDFKLLQLSWIFDLNYGPAFQLLRDRNYIGRIIAKLPPAEEIKKLSVFLTEYVRQRLSMR